MRKRVREAGRAQGAADTIGVWHQVGPSSGATSLRRLPRIRRLSRDPASAEFSHRTGCEMECGRPRPLAGRWAARHPDTVSGAERKRLRGTLRPLYQAGVSGSADSARRASFSARCRRICCALSSRTESSRARQRTDRAAACGKPRRSRSSQPTSRRATQLLRAGRVNTRLRTRRARGTLRAFVSVFIRCWSFTYEAIAPIGTYIHRRAGSLRPVNTFLAFD